MNKPTLKNNLKLTGVIKNIQNKIKNNYIKIPKILLPWNGIISTRSKHKATQRPCQTLTWSFYYRAVDKSSKAPIAERQNIAALFDIVNMH